MRRGSRPTSSSSDSLERCGPYAPRVTDDLIVIKDDLLGLADHAFGRLRERHRQLAGTLSGGEQQMLAIGRAIMSKPEIVMFDEPSIGLSPALTDVMFSVVKLLHEQGATILLVEQNVAKSLSLSNRGYVLENGSVVLHGSSEELLSNSEVQRAYLGM